MIQSDPGTPAAPGRRRSLRDLALVTVLYGSASTIAGCLESVPADVEVIVVDNASSDDGAAVAKAVRPDARVIRSERNLGFGPGCNVGWRAAQRPVIAFVNPDVRLHADTLARLLERLEAEPHAIVGPAMLDESGAARRCKRRPSALADLLGLLPAAARWAPSGWDGRVAGEAGVHAHGGVVDSVEGACFLVRRSDLETVGGFDEDFFLYYEEESLALRLARLGGRAIYEPSVAAEHVGGASTRADSALATRHMYRSRVLFYRKRDGTLRGLLTGAMLIAGVLATMPVAVVNALLRRPRPNTPSRQWQVLRGLLAGMTARPRSGVRYSG
jgi:N-acetylglucosaminyl-diphospho-decaprenol L-rhamnosyltransferase